MKTFEPGRLATSFAAMLSASVLVLLATANQVEASNWSDDDARPGQQTVLITGANATFTVKESAQGIRNVVANLSPEDSGTFWNFDGAPLPW